MEYVFSKLGFFISRVSFCIIQSWSVNIFTYSVSLNSKQVRAIKYMYFKSLILGRNAIHAHVTVTFWHSLQSDKWSKWDQINEAVNQNKSVLIPDQLAYMRVHTAFRKCPSSELVQTWRMYSL